MIVLLTVFVIVIFLGLAVTITCYFVLTSQLVMLLIELSASIRVVDSLLDQLLFNFSISRR